MPNSSDRQQIELLAQSILQTCALRFGGVGPLASYLDVSPEELSGWVAGESMAPPEILLKAVSAERAA